jgi:type III pantothenate kinase
LANLVIDIGNTRTKLGCFSAGKLQETAASPAYSLAEMKHWASRYSISDIIVSSVATPDEGLMNGLRDLFPVLEMTSEVDLPFINTYTTPHTLGKDRLAAVAGAQALFPATDCLVIDGGTCLKYEVLTADGRYLGGNISPGLRMRSKAMHHFTARLPEADLGLPDNPIGDSTLTALQNGAFLGAILEVKGFVQLLEQHLKQPLQVIYTGGDAPFLNKYLSFKNQVVEENLTLIGLNEILIKNKK